MTDIGKFTFTLIDQETFSEFQHEIIEAFESQDLTDTNDRMGSIEEFMKTKTAKDLIKKFTNKLFGHLSLTELNRLMDEMDKFVGTVGGFKGDLRSFCARCI